jgi:hypothetical protein
MATLESMAMRSNAALDRIQKQLKALGVEFDTQRLHREREMLRCIQLEAVAAALDKVQVNPTPRKRKVRRK